MACSMKRLRFNVPIEDDEVLAWLSQQSSVSVSLRMLVHDAIRKRDGNKKVAKRESVEKKAEVKPQQTSAVDAISRMQGLLDN